MALPARARTASALLLALLAAVMLSTVRDYGMTGDEGVQHRYARRVLHWYATAGADRSAVAEEDISMYGAFFEGLAEAAASASPLDPYDTRHVVNVLFALAAFAAALRMGRHLGGPEAASWPSCCWPSRRRSTATPSTTRRTSRSQAPLPSRWP